MKIRNFKTPMYDIIYTWIVLFFILVISYLSKILKKKKKKIVLKVSIHFIEAWQKTESRYQVIPNPVADCSDQGRCEYISQGSPEKQKH